jgi:hypothetical protein
MASDDDAPEGSDGWSEDDWQAYWEAYFDDMVVEFIIDAIEGDYE